jgi:hypothetical protein
MPYSLRMEGNLSVLEIFGKVTPHDLLRIATDVLALERSQPVSPNRFTDLSAITEFGFSYETLSNIASLRRASPPANPIKSAFYVASATQFGAARMFQTLNQGHNLTIEIFRDKAAAFAWLGAPPPQQL